MEAPDQENKHSFKEGLPLEFSPQEGIREHDQPNYFPFSSVNQTFKGKMG